MSHGIPGIPARPGLLVGTGPGLAGTPAGPLLAGERRWGLPKGGDGGAEIMKIKFFILHIL